MDKLSKDKFDFAQELLKINLRHVENVNDILSNKHKTEDLCSKIERTNCSLNSLNERVSCLSSEIRGNNISGLTDRVDKIECKLKGTSAVSISLPEQRMPLFFIIWLSIMTIYAVVHNILSFMRP